MHPKAGELVTLKVESREAVDIACSRTEGLWPVPAKPEPGNAEVLWEAQTEIYGELFSPARTAQNRIHKILTENIGLQTDVH